VLFWRKKYATPKGPEGIPLEDAFGAKHQGTKLHHKKTKMKTAIIPIVVRNTA
jgi:hypothetical protein